jgi:hypothetical protein
MTMATKHEHKRIAERERERIAGFTKGYRMATTAIHMLGDISRDVPSLCYIREESGEDYIGEWVTGYGFIEVRFPKATTRKLTPAEYERFNGGRLAMSNGVVTDPRMIDEADVEWPA